MAKLNPCKHEQLEFSANSGTCYLVCTDCRAKWLAVNDIDQPRYEALLEGYGVNPERQSPFYIKPIPTRRK